MYPLFGNRLKEVKDKAAKLHADKDNETLCG
jgi:hypothetical protein